MHFGQSRRRRHRSRWKRSGKRHAVSRELAIAEHYYRPASPAMKKLIAMVVDAARKADIPVTICGLAVGNAVNATQYLHLGLRSFSMSPQNLLTIKKALRDADAK